MIEEKDWWYDSIDENNYISEGAEQKVYLSATEKCVIKTNTTIFSDYLDNLLLHNLFFPTTQYELLGFTMQEGTLYAVVKQPFVPSNEDTGIAHVKRLLASNGFVNNKNNDYYHASWGIILEDLHEGNVLTYNGVLFFIDTVFYTTEAFFS